MAHLIDKDALVAKIERIRNLVGDGKFLSEYESGCRDKTLDICNDLLSFLDTLEVKEVDLEKEYNDFIKSDNCRSIFETAKYFFELGLRAQKGDKL